MMTRMILAVLLVALAGCNDEDGLSQSDVEQLINPLQSRISTLEADLAATNQDLAAAVASIESNTVGDRVVFGSSSTFESGARSLVQPSAGAIGTAMQFNASSLTQSRGLAVRLDTDYLVDLEFGRTSTGVITFVTPKRGDQPYESTDCGLAGGDQPLLFLQDVGVQAQQQGAVFAMYDVGTNGLPADSLERRDPLKQVIWQLLPGSSPETVTLGSILRSGNNCDTSFTLIENEVFRLIPNDPLVTGVENEPYDGVPTISGS